ncbi:MAG: GNAT family N-acetyltransferase [Chloroflexi bacterium]|nr:GNAT family N-acetyltransferase [Chloroflexota bacterium]
MTDLPTGRVLQVNVSDGGVPKRPVPSARVTSAGVAGDRQNADTVHGGPHRAVSILGVEVIERLRAEGHPIEPGSTGENLTIAGFDVSTLEAGTRLAIGDELVLEISQPTNPCRTIRRSFKDGRFGRLSIRAHPTDSRMYARVITAGTVAPDDEIRVEPAVDPSAAGFAISDRLDNAERESSIVFWEAAVAAGRRIAILDDGEIAASAAPDLPGPIFNQGLGFAHLPNLVDRAIAHFRDHGVTGWILADDPPWDGAVVDATLARWALESPLAPVEVPGLVVRELARDEIGPWADVIVAASEMPPAIGETWRELERHLALAAHHHRFVAEIDGTPVGAGSLHLHHQLGWLRAGSVLPSHRGRGVQRALIAERATHAWRLGADAVGASTLEGGASAANVERLGFRRVATRRSYVTDPA